MFIARNVLCTMLCYVTIVCSPFTYSLLARKVLLGKFLTTAVINYSYNDELALDDRLQVGMEQHFRDQIKKTKLTGGVKF